MNFTAGRYAHLVNCLAGYKKTGVSLIECNGSALMPSFAADDLGIYILIPKLAHVLHCSIDTAISIFFNGILFGSFLAGLAAFFLLYRSWLSRIISFFCLSSLVLFSFFKVGDVYVLYVSSALALIPWTLYFLTTNNFIAFSFFNFFAGIYIGFAHYCRSFSSLATLLCILVLIACSRIVLARKIFLLISMLFGLSASMFYVTSEYNRYVLYVKNNFPEYSVSQNGHVFWHTVFCGFGFLNFNNKDNIQWNDTCGEQRALSIDSEATIDKTERYEAVLKNEVITILKKQPLFFIFTVWAKIGVLLLYFLLFAHVGILAAFLFPSPWYINLAFFVALACSALFPIVAIPTYTYSLGFMVFTVLWSVISINNALYASGFLRYTVYGK